MANGEPGSARSKLPNRSSSGAGNVWTNIAEVTEGRRPSTIILSLWNAASILASAAAAEGSPVSSPNKRASLATRA